MKQLRTALFSLLLLLPLLLLPLSGCSLSGMLGEDGTSGTVSANAEDLKVHFIDVGQADCILIQSAGHNMLIDAGNRDDGDAILAYLAQNNVSQVDYVIATHPHEDHIGGMAQVINGLTVKAMILPGKEHTTSVFKKMMDAMEQSGCEVIAPQVGKTYSIGNAQFTILSPGDKDYGDALNNWSVGIRLTYGKTAFVMCGDAETEAEADMIATGLTLKADVLKLGHHGSSTSTSDAFLQAVDPAYAIISCGKNNDYGHPHREIVQKLEQAGISSFRTDELGTILAVSDGGTVSLYTGEKLAGSITGSSAAGTPSQTAAPSSSAAAETQAKTNTYVLNTNTKKFHLPTCSSVSKIKDESAKTVESTRDALLAQGYSPCGSCKP